MAAAVCGRPIPTCAPRTCTSGISVYEREIMKNTALEIRYVGNNAPNTWRAYNINEVNIFENGFLQEFKECAKSISRLAAGQALPRVALACLCLCRSSISSLPVLQRATLIRTRRFFTNLSDNNVGGFANTLAFNSTYRANRESTALGLPGNFFVANPNAAFVNILANDSYSNYNAMEIEIRRRFSSGLQFQADYTWSKAMGNASDAQGNNQNDLVSRLTLRNPRRRLSPFAPGPDTAICRQRHLRPSFRKGSTFFERCK